MMRVHLLQIIRPQWGREDTTTLTLSPKASYYIAGHLVRGRTAGADWISYLRKGAFFTNIRITTPQKYDLPMNTSLAFLMLVFLALQQVPSTVCSDQALYNVR